jgi:hypothetical protein
MRESVVRDICSLFATVVTSMSPSASRSTFQG